MEQTAATSEMVASLVTIASIAAGFGSMVLHFRFERELKMLKAGEVTWIPWADWLVIIATSTNLLLVVFPSIYILKNFSSTNKDFLLNLSVSACAASTILLAAYPFAILAHYRFFSYNALKKPRKNPEPAEMYIVYIAIAVALTAAILLWS